MIVFVLMVWLGLGEDNVLSKNTCFGDIHCFFFSFFVFFARYNYMLLHLADTFVQSDFLTLTAETAMHGASCSYGAICGFSILLKDTLIRS